MKKYLVGQLYLLNGKTEFKFIDIITSDIEDKNHIIQLYNEKYKNTAGSSAIIGELYNDKVILSKDIIQYVDNKYISKIININESSDYKKMWEKLKIVLIDNNSKLEKIAHEFGVPTELIFHEVEIYKRIINIMNSIEENKNE